jgi:hypothetical protein
MSDQASIKIPPPQERLLQVFAFDPSLNASLETAVINQLRLAVPWEDLHPGPVGEYLEVVDVDPPSGYFYPPVNLDHPHLLVQDGLPPSESSPQFHQQMVYAVASKTIHNFELALGRKVLWAPRKDGGQEEYVPRLRLYPHAVRQSNAYYSPQKKAILFGYFPSAADAGPNLPGGIVFTCLSHDIIAHETTHALLDGLHPYFADPSNPDVLALHEAFADIVALFQHFSHPDVLRHQIARTRGDLGSANLLVELARQFGQATGVRGALRSAIGQPPDPARFEATVEPHARGSILVAAVFDAFLTVYKHRIADLLRIATGGSGVLPQGDIHPDLVNRLAEEAAQVAQHILGMCIRALDYCPPVDITFGEYLRGLITGDYDLDPQDREGYRIAMIESFRQRGIYPSNVRSLSEESLLWTAPDGDPVLAEFFDFHHLTKIQWYESVQNVARNPRKTTFRAEVQFRQQLKNWIYGVAPDSAETPDELERIARSLRSKYEAAYAKEDERQELVGNSLNLNLWPLPGLKSIFAFADGSPEIEVNSARLAYRVDAARRTRVDLVVEINQRRRGYLDPQVQDQVDAGQLDPPPPPDFIFRGGATLLIDTETGQVRYVISKSASSQRRIKIMRRYLAASEQAFRMSGNGALTYFGDPHLNYFRGEADGQEPFALLHASARLEEEF